MDTANKDSALEQVAEAIRVTLDTGSDADLLQQCQQQQPCQQATAPPAEHGAVTDLRSTGQSLCKSQQADSKSVLVDSAGVPARSNCDTDVGPSGFCPAPHSSSSDVLQSTQHSAADVNSLKRKPDTLRHRVCPAFGFPNVHVLSLCHLLDSAPDHSCRTNHDCGVDSVSCHDRVCSVHGFCQID